MENKSRNTTSSTLSFVDFVGICFHTIPNGVNDRFQFLYSKFMSLFRLQFQPFLPKINSNAKATKNVPNQHLCSNDDDSRDVAMVSKEDIKMVMGIMFSNPDDENQSTTIKCLGGSEFSSLFEEMEPSFDEVKEAFDVFDVNRDGFVDAKELQRVLRALGFREAISKLEACERMIRAFDTKGEGRVDFIEFVKLMENSFE